MKTIQTVTGPMRLDEVKHILPHEHLLLDLRHEAIEPKTEEARKLFYGEITMETLGALRRNPYIVRRNLGLWDEDLACKEARYLIDCDCNLLLDLTSVGIRRNVRALKRISERTGLRIVCGCGQFVHDSGIDEYRSLSAEAIAERMIQDIETGVDGTDIRAGAIGEIGISERIYPEEERGLRAAAVASVHTGLPVFVHTYPWSRAGLEAIDLLVSLGVKPEMICICHMDVRFDEQYMKAVMDRGSYLEFDNLGKEFVFEPAEGSFAGGPFETDVDRVRMLKKLSAEGYAERILLSNDLCLQASLHAFGGWGYDHMFRNFVPMMKMGGMTQAEIDTMVDGNPRRFLFGER